MNGPASTRPPGGWKIPGRYLLGALLLLVVVDLAFTSVHVVESSEQGLVLRFGQHVRMCGPGMQLVLPWPVETLRKCETTQVRSMPVGFTLIDEQRGIPPSPEELQWLTGDTNIVEMKTEIQYLVGDPYRYLFRVAEVDEGDHPRFALRKVAEAVLTDLVACMEVDDVLGAGKVRIQEAARPRIQDLVDELELGLQIVSVNILDCSPPLAVKSAFNDVSSARADRERLMAEAEGFSMDLLPRARARADWIRSEAEIARGEKTSHALGRARTFRQLVEGAAGHREITMRRLWLEKVEQILSRGRVVVYPREDGHRFRLTEVK